MGIGIYLTLDERRKRMLTEDLLRLSENIITQGKELVDDYADRLLLAIKLGIEEAKKKEEEFEKKLGASEV